MIYDDHRRSDAARIAGVGLQIIRDWVLRFNAEGPEGLVNRKAPGPAYKLSEEQRAALAAVVESGPDPAIHGVLRWRRCDLAAWLRDRFGISLGVTTVGQELRRMGYAAMVLKAKSDLEAAIMAAKTDQTEAESAKAALSADADPALVQAVDEAIMAAETKIEAAEEVLDGDDVADYVEMVTGTDEDDVKIAADKGEEVAMAIAMALGLTSRTDGAGTRVTHGTTIPAATIPEANKFSTNDAAGMTWAMIVGEDNVMGERTGTGNAVRMVASVAGMTAVDIDTDLSAEGGANSDGRYDDAFMSTGSTYKGIPGDIFCLGSDCEVNANGDLAGSWYFSPTSESAFYTQGDDGMYSAETLYATYGHWLVMEDHDSDPATPDVARVNSFATSTVTDTGVWDAADPSSTDAGLRAVSATYSGMAAGRSVHKTLDSNGAITDIQSGRFTANLTLTAEFGASPMLGGMMSGFTSPDNPGTVDSSWTVELMKTNSLGGTVAASTDGATGGIAKATGQNGTWSATLPPEAWEGRRSSTALFFWDLHREVVGNARRRG